jgi:hypothetical protein
LDSKAADNKSFVTFKKRHLESGGIFFLKKAYDVSFAFHYWKNIKEA